MTVVLISSLVLLLDQISKFIASRFGLVSLNYGISFGWFSSLPSWLVTLSLALLLVGVWLALGKAWKPYPIESGLFIGGAVSNLLDRVLVGAVRDWLPLPLTAVHNNLADYAIGVSLILLLYNYWRSYPEDTPTDIYED